MRILYLEYALWAAQMSTLGVVYECITGSGACVWAGGKDFIYQTDVDATKLVAFQAAFSTRVTVTSEDEVIARINNFVGTLS